MGGGMRVRGVIPLRQQVTAIAAALAAVLAAAASVVLTPGTGAAATRAVTTTASTVTATGLYANASGLVMDAGGARKSGVTVRVHKDGTANGNRWLREKDWTIRPAYDTRLCLDVPRARYQVGTALDVATCRGITSQRFATYRSSRSTPMFFISPVGDRKLCLSLSSGFFDAGDAVTLDKCGPVLTAPGTEVWAATSLDTTAGEIDSTIALGVAGSTAGSPALAVQSSALTLNSLWEVGTENVAPYGQERVLRSVANTSLCLTRIGAEAAGAALRLETCSGSPAQAFMGIQILYNSNFPGYYITEPDGRFCVAITSGAVNGHDAALGRCVGTAADLWTAATWTTGMDLTTQQSYQYQEIYTDGYVTPQFALSLTGTGAGAKTVLAGDESLASQVWTDLGPSGRVGNADGSMSLRPLSNQGLCLTVPGGKYATGQQLAAEPCTGNLDQEFFRMPSIGFNGTEQQELVPYGDGGLCLGMPKGLKAGAAVTLLPCSYTQAQAWNPFEAWYRWGGEPAEVNAYPLGFPAQHVLTVGSLTGTSATAAAAPFSMGRTSMAWFPVTSSDGTHWTFRLAARTGWCLDATTTAVTAQACNGGTSQEFTFSSEVGGDGITYLQLKAAAAPGFCVSAGTGSGTVPVTLASCAQGISSQMWYVYAP
jgi:hypothetical protein